MQKLSTNKKSGQGLVEYALLIALMVLVFITAMGMISDTVNEILNSSGTKIEEVSTQVSAATTP